MSKAGSLGRNCVDCGLPLSRYNSEDRCHSCLRTGMPPRRPEGRRRRVPLYPPPEALARPDFLEACARLDFGAMFRIVYEYKDQGWTLNHIGRRCEIDPASLRYYMQGARQPESVYVIERIADGFRIPGEMLGISRRPWEAENTPDADPRHVSNVESLQRREHVPSLEFTSADGLVGRQQMESLRRQVDQILSQGAMSDVSLDEWELTAIRYARETRDCSALNLAVALGRDMAELSGVLIQQHPASASRRLTRVMAQMSGLMCWVFCVLDDRLAFRQWARTAKLAGNESGDSEALSWVLAQEAYGYYYSGNISEAIDVAKHAYEIAKAPCTGSALAAALEARAQAIMRRGREARDALKRAEDALSHLTGDALVPSAFGYNEASFRFHEGNTYMHLGDIDSAFKAQERALELCAPGNYTDWAMTRLDRAQCLACSGNIADGLRYATETITDLTEPQRQGIIILRAKEIVEVLPGKEKKLQAVRDFNEFISDTSKHR